jgi:hypothetical protein
MPTIQSLSLSLSLFLCRHRGLKINSFPILKTTLKLKCREKLNHRKF